MKGAALFLLIVVIIAAWVMSAGGFDFSLLLPPSLDELEMRAEDQLSSVDRRRLATGRAEATAAFAQQATAQAWYVQSTAVAQATVAEATRRVNAELAMVQMTATTEVWRVTVAAGQAQATSTAEIGALYLRWTQESIDREATKEAAAVGAIATNQNVQAELSVQDLEREIRVTETWGARSWGMLIGAIAALLTAGYATIRITKAHEAKAQVIPANEDGSKPLLVVGGKVINAERALDPMLDPANGNTVHPALQSRITENAQKVEAIRALSNGGRNAGATRIAASMAEPMQDTTAQQGALPESAPWAAMMNWPGNGKFALGVGAGNQVIQHDPTANAPHLLFAGTSRSGKSRYGLRVVIVQALASGYQVVIMDRSMVDFSVFEKHPNAHLVLVEDPSAVTEYLHAVYGEIVRRMREMAAIGVSTWDRGADFPPVLIVLDEFSNLADDCANSREREALWRAARMVAAEGGKTGVFLALALQDPTKESMDLRIRRNCTKVAYKVQDVSASQVVLGSPGAEKLPKRHFMTVIEGLREGVAFDPLDADVDHFLANHAVPALPDPAWLEEREHGEETALDREARIIELHRQGFGTNEIQRQVFGYTGGTAYTAVKAAIDGSTTNADTSTGSIDTEDFSKNREDDL